MNVSERKTAFYRWVVDLILDSRDGSYSCREDAEKEEFEVHTKVTDPICSVWPFCPDLLTEWCEDLCPDSPTCKRDARCFGLPQER